MEQKGGKQNNQGGESLILVDSPDDGFSLSQEKTANLLAKDSPDDFAFEGQFKNKGKEN